MAGKKTEIELGELLSIAIGKIVDNFTVDEILVFGSYAKGTANDWSDIDIAVISPDLRMDKPICDNVLTITKKIKLFDPDIQFVAFPSEKYYNETFIDPGFIREIKNTGKQVYTKSKGLDLSLLF